MRWIVLCAVYLVLLVTTALPAALIVSTRTRAEPHGRELYDWGWIWGTHDNPPQGDEGYVRKRAPYPGITDGWKGYVNRVAWMLRNPLYGYALRAGVRYRGGRRVISGNPDISDKYRIPGWMRCAYYERGELVAWELYCVLPYTRNRCLRARLGWKIKSDKFFSTGRAQLVCTINPLDGYGDD